ncbi:MAG: MATE family efflux transporter [Rikenellaceae bacterium]|jgi:putative MATE family efflux protein|nr:MATE family efflux transporter [Rikenellaceae bacterium]
MADNSSSALELGQQPIGKLLLKYSIPAVVGMVVVSLYNIIDRVFIGQGVGAMAISGLALTFPLMNMVAAIGTLVGVGAATRISIVLGMQNVKWARNILGNALFLTFILSAVLIAPSMIWMEEILRLFGGSDQTIPYASSYLRIVIPGSVLTNLSFSFGGMMRAAGFPKKSMLVNIIGVVFNLILDPIFIFGLDMGIEGAAWATVISMAASAVFVMVHFADRRNEVHFERQGFRLKKRIIRNIVSIGMAPFLMNTAGSVVNIIMNHQLYRTGGDLAIGAFGIINSYAAFIVMTILGLCQGMQPIVGYNYGAKKLKRMKDTVILSLKVATAIMCVGFLAGEFLPRALVSVFTTDLTLREMTIPGLRTVFMCFPLIGIQIVTTQFHQSIGMAKEAIFMSLSRQVIFLMPLIYVFGTHWGLSGVWAALPVADATATITAVFFLIRVKRIFYPRPAIRFKKA